MASSNDLGENVISTVVALRSETNWNERPTRERTVRMFSSSCSVRRTSLSQKTYSPEVQVNVFNYLVSTPFVSWFRPNDGA
ncbi:hypothetical protein CFRS1_v015135 [Colletotrichum fructicola]|nr:hypothetical protein CFRS1_v015135 [Colletotrichum fructicola]